MLGCWNWLYDQKHTHTKTSTHTYRQAHTHTQERQEVGVLELVAKDIGGSKTSYIDMNMKMQTHTRITEDQTYSAPQRRFSECSRQLIYLIM